MGKYKIGDWLIDKQTKQVLNIVNICQSPHPASVFTLCKLDNGEFWYTHGIDMRFDKLDHNCSAAQVLYGNSSNKVVTNETNEE